MKKTVLPVLLTGCLLVACTTTTVTNENTIKENTKEDVKEMDYIAKNDVKNQFAGDCPVEVSAQRADVGYGQVSHVTYFSNTCNMNRAFSIYLPSSYDGTNKYPVVYFQHGIFGDENCIIHDGNNKIREILSNLAADGNAKEMIMVFGNMYATDDPKMKPGFAAEAVLPYDNYINELVNDIMPYVESHYEVLTGRENTAVCGFSMGGRESLFIGLQRPDLFGYIGAIAPAPGLVPGKDWAMTHVGQLAEEDAKFKEGQPLPILFMVCCGTNDRTVGQFPKTYHNLFEKNGVEHMWFEVIGADHDSHAIRSGLYQFATRVFK